MTQNHLLYSQHALIWFRLDIYWQSSDSRDSLVLKTMIICSLFADSILTIGLNAKLITPVKQLEKNGSICILNFQIHPK